MPSSEAVLGAESCLERRATEVVKLSNCELPALVELPAAGDSRSNCTYRRTESLRNNRSTYWRQVETLRICEDSCGR
jgi:hypothetical protein